MVKGRYYLIFTTIPVGEYLAMDEDLAKTYVEEYLVAGENSTAAAFVEEYLTMNDVTEKFIKEYVISRIRDNLTSIAVSINDFGYLVVTPSTQRTISMMT
jgi:hypothetical protein